MRIHCTDAIWIKITLECAMITYIYYCYVMSQNDIHIILCWTEFPFKMLLWMPSHFWLIMLWSCGVWFFRKDVITMLLMMMMLMTTFSYLCFFTVLQKREVCRDYMKHNCQYGNTCKYLHPPMKRSDCLFCDVLSNLCQIWNCMWLCIIVNCINEQTILDTSW